MTSAGGDTADLAVGGQEVVVGPAEPSAATTDHPAPDDDGSVAERQSPAPWYRLLPGSTGDGGGCLLVATASAQTGAVAWDLASAVPREPGRLSIVMLEAPASLMPRLARHLRQWVPDPWDTVRLVASRSGAPQLTGTPAAQELAECLGVEVLAPEGDVVLVPGGSLFVFDPAAPNARPGWVRFRPMRAPKPAGRRVPVPEWESALAPLGDSGATGVTVSEIPVGLWVHGPGPPPPLVPAGPGARERVYRAVLLGTGPDGSSTSHYLDLAYSIPRSSDSVAVLVSRPGDPGVTSAALGQVLSALPDPVLERLVVLPYGARPIVDGSLGAAVSRAANRTVRVGNGLPLYLPGRGPQVTAIGTDGVPTWRPFAHDLVWRPQGGARVVRWTAPVDHLLPVAHGRLAIDEWWVVEVIESGLWIRQRDTTGPAWLVRELPLDARYCNVVIGAPSAIQVAPPWRPIARLLRHLPSDARRRVRVLVPWGAGDWVARAARRSLVSGLGRRGVWVLRPDGIVGPNGR